ncbi:MAG: TonB-dependent receptor [Steroidobacteraceae bacterium]
MQLTTSVIRDLAVFAVAIGASIVALPSHAAEPKPAGDAGLEEVVVTAQRFQSSIQTTPIAVTAISGKALEERGIGNVLDAAEEIPGIVIEPITGSSNAMRVVSRGANQELAGFRNQPTMGVYVDDVVQPRLVGSFFDFYDIERMEVLRGPQGTLYGRNSSGGAMKIQTKRPTYTWTGGGQLSGGNWAQREAKGYVSGPIIADKLAFSVSGVKRQRDGFIYGLVPQRLMGRQDVRAERIKFLFTPTDNLEMSLAVSLSQNYSDGGISIPITVGPGVVDPYAVPLSQAAACIAAAKNCVRDLSFTENVGLGENSLNQNAASLNMTYTLSDAVQFHSITGYARQYSRSVGEATFAAPGVTNAGATVIIGSNNDGWTLAKWWSQELNATFTTPKLQGVVGYYYFGESGFNRATSAASTVSDGDHGVMAPAIFGNVTYSIIEGLSATLGARYTQETTTFYTFTQGSTVPPVVGRSRFVAMTPKAGLNWQINPQLFGYASYTRGFRSGGFNTRDPVTAELSVNPYGPEFVDSYEIGGKFQTPGNKFRLNVAIYRAEYEGMHLATFIPGTAFTITSPAAGARIEGIEMEPTWQVREGLQLYGNMSLARGEYTDTFICNSQFSVRIDCRTKDPKGVIPLKSNLGVRYSPQLSMLPGKLTTNLSWAHNDFYYNNTVNEPEIIQSPENDLFNASVAWSDGKGRWSASIEARNLFDKIYRQAGLLTTHPTQPSTVVYMGPRRLVIGRVGLSF